MHEKEIIYTDESSVFCDGESGELGDASGHPRIYLTFKTDTLVCPYCSRLFKNKTIKNQQSFKKNNEKK